MLQSTWMEIFVMVLLFVDVACLLVELLVETEVMMFTDHQKGEHIEHGACLHGACLISPSYVASI